MERLKRIFAILARRLIRWIKRVLSRRTKEVHSTFVEKESQQHSFKIERHSLSSDGSDQSKED